MGILPSRESHEYPAAFHFAKSGAHAMGIMPLTEHFFPSPDCLAFRQLCECRDRQSAKYNFAMMSPELVTQYRARAIQQSHAAAERGEAGAAAPTRRRKPKPHIRQKASNDEEDRTASDTSSWVAVDTIDASNFDMFFQNDTRFASSTDLSPPTPNAAADEDSKEETEVEEEWCGELQHPNPSANWRTQDAVRHFTLSDKKERGGALRSDIEYESESPDSPSLSPLPPSYGASKATTTEHITFDGSRGNAATTTVQEMPPEEREAVDHFLARSPAALYDALVVKPNKGFLVDTNEEMCELYAAEQRWKGARQVVQAYRRQCRSEEAATAAGFAHRDAVAVSSDDHGDANHRSSTTSSPRRRISREEAEAAAMVPPPRLFLRPTPQVIMIRLSREEEEATRAAYLEKQQQRHTSDLLGPCTVSEAVEGSAGGNSAAAPLSLPDHALRQEVRSPTPSSRSHLHEPTLRYHRFEDDPKYKDGRIYLVEEDGVLYMFAYNTAYVDPRLQVQQQCEEARKRRGEQPLQQQQLDKSTAFAGTSSTTTATACPVRSSSAAFPTVVVPPSTQPLSSSKDAALSDLSCAKASRGGEEEDRSRTVHTTEKESGSNATDPVLPGLANRQISAFYHTVTTFGNEEEGEEEEDGASGRREPHSGDDDGGTEEQRARAAVSVTSSKIDDSTSAYSEDKYSAPARRRGSAGARSYHGDKIFPAEEGGDAVSGQPFEVDKQNCSSADDEAHRGCRPLSLPGETSPELQHRTSAASTGTASMAKTEERPRAVQQLELVTAAPFILPICPVRVVGCNAYRESSCRGTPWLRGYEEDPEEDAYVESLPVRPPVMTSSSFIDANIGDKILSRAYLLGFQVYRNVCLDAGLPETLNRPFWTLGLLSNIPFLQIVREMRFRVRAAAAEVTRGYQKLRDMIKGTENDLQSYIYGLHRILPYLEQASHARQREAEVEAQAAAEGRTTRPCCPRILTLDAPQGAAAADSVAQEGESKLPSSPVSIAFPTRSTQTLVQQHLLFPADEMEFHTQLTVRGNQFLSRLRSDCQDVFFRLLAAATAPVSTSLFMKPLELSAYDYGGAVRLHLLQDRRTGEEVMQVLPPPRNRDQLLADHRQRTASRQPARNATGALDTKRTAVPPTRKRDGSGDIGANNEPDDDDDGNDNDGGNSMYALPPHQIFAIVYPSSQAQGPSLQHYQHNLQDPSIATTTGRDVARGPAEADDSVTCAAHQYLYPSRSFVDGDMVVYDVTTGCWIHFELFHQQLLAQQQARKPCTEMVTAPRSDGDTSLHDGSSNDAGKLDTQEHVAEREMEGMMWANEITLEDVLLCWIKRRLQRAALHHRSDPGWLRDAEGRIMQEGRYFIWGFEHDAQQYFYGLIPKFAKEKSKRHPASCDKAAVSTSSSGTQGRPPRLAAGAPSSALGPPSNIEFSRGGGGRSGGRVRPSGSAATHRNSGGDQEERDADGPLGMVSSAAATTANSSCDAVTETLTVDPASFHVKKRPVLRTPPQPKVPDTDTPTARGAAPLTLVLTGSTQFAEAGSVVSPLMLSPATTMATAATTVVMGRDGKDEALAHRHADDDHHHQELAKPRETSSSPSLVAAAPREAWVPPLTTACYGVPSNAPSVTDGPASEAVPAGNAAAALPASMKATADATNRRERNASRRQNVKLSQQQQQQLFAYPYSVPPAVTSSSYPSPAAAGSYAPVEDMRRGYGRGGGRRGEGTHVQRSWVENSPMDTHPPPPPSSSVSVAHGSRSYQRAPPPAQQSPYPMALQSYPVPIHSTLDPGSRTQRSKPSTDRENDGNPARAGLQPRRQIERQYATAQYPTNSTSFTANGGSGGGSGSDAAWFAESPPHRSTDDQHNSMDHGSVRPPSSPPPLCQPHPSEGASHGHQRRQDATYPQMQPQQLLLPPHSYPATPYFNANGATTHQGRNEMETSASQTPSPHHAQELAPPPPSQQEQQQSRSSLQTRQSHPRQQQQSHQRPLPSSYPAQQDMLNTAGPSERQASHPHLPPQRPMTTVMPVSVYGNDPSAGAALAQPQPSPTLLGPSQATNRYASRPSAREEPTSGYAGVAARTGLPHTKRSSFSSHGAIPTPLSSMRATPLYPAATPQGSFYAGPPPAHAAPSPPSQWSATPAVTYPSPAFQVAAVAPSSPSKVIHVGTGGGCASPAMSAGQPPSQQTLGASAARRKADAVAADLLYLSADQRHGPQQQLQNHLRKGNLSDSYTDPVADPRYFQQVPQPFSLNHNRPPTPQQQPQQPPCASPTMVHNAARVGPQRADRTATTSSAQTKSLTLSVDTEASLFMSSVTNPSAPISLAIHAGHRDAPSSRSGKARYDGVGGSFGSQATAPMMMEAPDASGRPYSCYAVPPPSQIQLTPQQQQQQQQQPGVPLGPYIQRSTASTPGYPPSRCETQAAFPQPQSRPSRNTSEGSSYRGHGGGAAPVAKHLRATEYRGVLRDEHRGGNGYDTPTLPSGSATHVVASEKHSTFSPSGVFSPHESATLLSQPSSSCPTSRPSSSYVASPSRQLQGGEGCAVNPFDNASRSGIRGGGSTGYPHPSLSNAQNIGEEPDRAAAGPSLDTTITRARTSPAYGGNNHNLAYVRPFSLQSTVGLPNAGGGPTVWQQPQPQRPLTISAIREGGGPITFTEGPVAGRNTSKSNTTAAVSNAVHASGSPPNAMVSHSSPVPSQNASGTLLRSVPGAQQRYKQPFPLQLPMPLQQQQQQQQQLSASSTPLPPPPPHQQQQQVHHGAFSTTQTYASPSYASWEVGATPDGSDIPVRMVENANFLHGIHSSNARETSGDSNNNSASVQRFVHNPYVMQ